MWCRIHFDLLMLSAISHSCLVFVVGSIILPEDVSISAEFFFSYFYF